VRANKTKNSKKQPAAEPLDQNEDESAVESIDEGEAIDELTAILGDEVAANDGRVSKKNPDQDNEFAALDSVDPVKVYLREMGSVSLLSSKQEVELAKQSVERGNQLAHGAEESNTGCVGKGVTGEM
jgi:hypothetical protein